MNLRLGQIKIAERTRQEFGNLSSLSDSIKKYGLIQPVVVEEVEPGNYRLVAGERRMRAAALAGVIEIPVVFRENLDSLTRKELELEENLHRRDLNWTEEVELKRKIDEIKREQYGHAMKSAKDDQGWSREKLAESLGQSIGRVHQDLELAEHLKEHPDQKEALARIPKTAAFRMMKEFKERARLEARGVPKEHIDKDFICSDAQTTLEEMETDSIDLIITDPPYGIPFLVERSAKHPRRQDDDDMTPDDLWKLMTEVCTAFQRILKPGRHIYCFTGPSSFQKLSEIFSDAGFMMASVPLIWSKETNQTPFSGLNYMRSYEMILFGFSRVSAATELRPLLKPCIDVLKFAPVSTAERNHAFEKPKALLQFLMDQSSLPNELIFDPFGGVASVVRAARGFHRRAFSCEVNEVHHAKGLELLKAGK